jgi:hypothetical protein
MRHFLFAALGATLLLSTAKANAQDHYGSLAFSASTGLWGSSWGFPDRGQSDYTALQNCAAPDCTVVAWVNNGCLAFAVGQGNAYGWAWNAGRGLAEDAALTQCSARTVACQLKTSFCSPQ